MSKHKYPRWRRTAKRYASPNPKQHPPCQALGCDGIAMTCEEYEVDYMRGNDEHARLCAAHGERLRAGDFTVMGFEEQR